MQLDLSPELSRFRDEVRAFLHENLTTELRRGQRLTTAMYPEPEISAPWQALLWKKGWLVPLWPREWGGTGWTAIERFLFETECALAGAPLVHPMGTRLVGPVILRYGTEDQKREHLPRILSGADYWCQGFSEPGAGSDLASLRTRAEADGDDYVVNGAKLWTTHAHHANRMFALVRTSTEGRRQAGISFLLINLAAPGISVRPIPTIGGDHDVNAVFFDNVRVHRVNRIGAENEGWACAKYLLEFERGAGIFSPRLRSQLKRVGDVVNALRIRSASRGPGHAGRTEVASETSLRVLLDSRFGEVCADLDAFEMLELKTLSRLAPGEKPGSVSSILKLRASRLKQTIGELGVEMLGTDGLRWRAPGESSRMLLSSEEEEIALRDSLLPEFLNSRAFTIFGGASEVQLGLIAKDVLRLYFSC